MAEPTDPLARRLAPSASTTVPAVRSPLDASVPVAAVTERVQRRDA
jgi:hypothetical protein